MIQKIKDVLAKYLGIHFHIWTNWEDSYNGLIQKRYCADCKYRQDRLV